MTELEKLASKYVDEKPDSDVFYDAFITGYKAALRIHDVVGRSEQLVCPHCKGLEVYIDEYGGKPCKCTEQLLALAQYMCQNHSNLDGKTAKDYLQEFLSQ